MTFKPYKTKGQVIDAVAYSVLDVRIVSAPDLYLADSKAWFPYRFIIDRLNTGQTATILGGQVEYWVGGARYIHPNVLNSKVSPSIRAPFPEQIRKNGESRDYIGLIDEAEFDPILTASAVVDTAPLRIKRIMFLVDGDKTVGSGGSDLHKDLKFGDRTIECIEIGDNETVETSKPATRQQVLQRQSDRSILRRTRVPPLVLPSGEAPLGWDKAIAQQSGSDTASFSLRVELFDDNDFWSVVPLFVNVEAQAIDVQRGVYFVAYYNQVPAGESGFNRTVVGKIGLAEGSSLFAKGTTVKLTAEDYNGGKVVSDLARQLLDVADKATKFAIAWEVPKVPKAGPYLLLATPILKLLDNITWPVPPEFEYGFFMGGLGQVENVTLRDEVQDIRPRSTLVEIKGSGVKFLKNGNNDGLLSRAENGGTASWQVGNMYQAQFSASVTVRATSLRVWERSGLVIMNVEIPYPQLEMKWSQLYGPDVDKAFVE